MKISRDLFEDTVGTLRAVNGIVYDTDARIFMFEEGTDHPLVHEPIGDYMFYATVGGETLLMEPGMIGSMHDESRSMAAPEGCPLPPVYFAGIGSHFDKPVEVLAMRSDLNVEGISPKWYVCTVRDVGDRAGFVDDKIAGAVLGSICSKIVEIGCLAK